MSGETEQQPSAWTVDSIRFMFEQQISNLQEQLDRREGDRARELALLRDALTMLEARRDADVDQIAANRGRFAVLDERLAGIDRATTVLSDTVTRTPTDIQKEITHLRELQTERFNSVEIQFHERDTRTEREARDNKLAVDAAFAAQEKQARAQEESNAIAISKSEKATAETIKTNQELNRATTDALTKSLDEVKLQVSRIESLKIGGTETMNNTRQTTNLIIGALALLVTIIAVAFTVYAAVHK